MPAPSADQTTQLESILSGGPVPKLMPNAELDGVATRHVVGRNLASVNDKWLAQQRVAGLMDVTARSVSFAPGDPLQIQISLEGSDGAVHRFRIPITGAAWLANSIVDTLAHHHPWATPQTPTETVASRDDVP